MPTFPLTAAWLKVASTGQAVELQNLSAAPVLITTGTAPPPTPDGLLLGALDTRVFALTADLYARTAAGVPATLEVMGGFTLPITSGAGVPFATVLPVVIGAATAGQVLTATTGAWTGAPTSYAYGWSRAGTTITGATAASYTAVAADVGQGLAVTVTATNGVGAATATSVATAAVMAASQAGGSTASVADFTDPNNAYLVALAA